MHTLSSIPNIVAGILAVALVVGVVVGVREVDGGVP